MSIAAFETCAIQTAGFRDDVLAGLARQPKAIPCKYFYDEAGSRLFEQICALDEYYLTRAELEIMQRHAAEMAELLGTDCLLIEYGSGSSRKTRHLLDHLVAPVAYVPIDIAGEALWESAQGLARRYPAIVMRPVCADFTRPIALPTPPRPARRRIVYFPGSTIGNLTPCDAVALLRQTARLVGTQGGLLLGVDLKKDPQRLHAAYNDASGVTAAFNLNLLVRINRELDADFDLTQFAHYAFYNPGPGRIEMHLVSAVPLRVRVGTSLFRFDAGESLRTEYSYKWAQGDLQQRAAASGYRLRRLWFDDEQAFCVAYLEVT